MNIITIHGNDYQGKFGGVRNYHENEAVYWVCQGMITRNDVPPHTVRFLFETFEQEKRHDLKEGIFRVMDLEGREPKYNVLDEAGFNDYFLRRTYEDVLEKQRHPGVIIATTEMPPLLIELVEEGLVELVSD